MCLLDWSGVLWVVWFMFSNHGVRLPLPTRHYNVTLERWKGPEMKNHEDTPFFSLLPSHLFGSRFV